LSAVSFDNQNDLLTKIDNVRRLHGDASMGSISGSISASARGTYFSLSGPKFVSNGVQQIDVQNALVKIMRDWNG
jgi:hypothetical protein